MWREEYLQEITASIKCALYKSKASPNYISVSWQNKSTEHYWLVNRAVAKCICAWRYTHLFVHYCCLDVLWFILPVTIPPCNPQSNRSSLCGNPFYPRRSRADADNNHEGTERETDSSWNTEANKCHDIRTVFTLVVYHPIWDAPFYF